MRPTYLSHRILSATTGERLLCVVAALLLLPSIGGAQTAPAQEVASSDNGQLIKQLLRRIDELEARVKELEGKEGKAAPAPAEKATGVKGEEDETKLHAAAVTGQTGREKPVGNGPSLEIQGFGDVAFYASDLKGTTSSFRLGQFDLFITSQLSEKLGVLSEVVIHAGHGNSLEIDLERLLLQYSLSEYLNFAFGRYHSSIGYYNTAYHHGTWFQTATGRPFIFTFEHDGGVLPIHNVGVSASGRIPSGGLGLRYVAELGNGRVPRGHGHLPDQPVQSFVDGNNGKAFNLGLLARPDWVPGLQAGFSIYRDRMSRDGGAPITETVSAAHVVYQNPAFEFFNEVFLIRHSPAGGGRTYNTPAFYTQVSRKFDRLRPYFRYEYFNAHDREPLLHDVRRRNGPSFGLRYDLDEFVALKGQYGRVTRRRLNSINEVTLQLAFTF